MPRRVVSGVSVIFLIARAFAALPQTQQSSSQSADAVKAEATKLYADAHPYLDAPFPELKKSVHELSGMIPSASQEQLPDLLYKVGVEADELFQNVPDLVSDEVVNEARQTISKGEPLGCVGLSCSSDRAKSAEDDQTYHYLLLTHTGALGRVAVSESRTELTGKPVDPTAQSPSFSGFLPIWILFYPVNQVESRFRYLGQQQIDGYNTFVIGFAQLPGSMTSHSNPILLQGIAWVDQSNFRIVRLHTDLLAPLPALHLLKQTSNVVFGTADIVQSNLQLWLPRRVDFEMEANGQFFHEDHKYSDYRLYKAAERTASSSIQHVNTASSDELKDEARTETKLYSEAHPYMDEPLTELRKTVHELTGLMPASSQDELPDLLAKTGSKADELLRRLPNLISDEGVSESHYSQDAANGCLGVGCISDGGVATRDELFHYMILTHPAQGSGLEVSEYRTARNGKPVGQSATGAPNFQGFISAWVVFTSANQAESRFRYLGQQRIDGHPAYVLGFAQTPGLVESPAQIVVNGESIPMLLQGVAWIDQSDFHILRLRTDLLAPLPLILVEQQTANILFGSIHIAELATELWLPKSVTLEMEVRGQVIREKHNYSKYRLFLAKSRIVLSPSDEPASK